MTRAFRTLGYLGISTGMVLLAFGLVLIPQNSALADEGGEGTTAGCYMTTAGFCDLPACTGVAAPSVANCTGKACKTGTHVPDPPQVDPDWDCSACKCDYDEVGMPPAGVCTCDEVDP